MLYNIELNKVRTKVDCQTCKYFDRRTKDCKGIGKCCFEYNEKTRTIFDPITKLPLKLERGEK
jgi:hypothetical protein